MNDRLSLEHDRDEGISAAAAAVASGQCVVVPTDTVYGIAADAFNAEAVQALLDAKERDHDMPAPVLLAEPLMLRAVAEDIPEAALALAKDFWPGALTLILKAQPKSGMQLGETGGTIAVRVPDHEGTRALLRVTGPLAVSSANISGAPPARTVEEAERQLGDRVAIYLDGGDAGTAPASTIVDFASTPDGRVVRLGALSLARLHEVAPGVAPLAHEPGQTGDQATESEERPGDQISDEASCANTS